MSVPALKLAGLFLSFYMYMFKHLSQFCPHMSLEITQRAMRESLTCHPKTPNTYLTLLILREFLLLVTCRMILLLGPPGAGKTTFLLASQNSLLSREILTVFVGLLGCRFLVWRYVLIQLWEIKWSVVSQGDWKGDLTLVSWTCHLLYQLSKVCVHSVKLCT